MCFVIRSVELTRVLLTAPFLAVGFDLRLVLQILLCLDDRERMTESLVLNDGSVADSLILAEHAVGKHATFRSDFERAVRELVVLFLPLDRRELIPGSGLGAVGMKEERIEQSVERLEREARFSAKLTDVAVQRAPACRRRVVSLDPRLHIHLSGCGF